MLGGRCRKPNTNESIHPEPSYLRPVRLCSRTHSSLSPHELTFFLHAPARSAVLPQSTSDDVPHTLTGSEASCASRCAPPHPTGVDTGRAPLLPPGVVPRTAASTPRRVDASRGWDLRFMSDPGPSRPTTTTKEGRGPSGRPPQIPTSDAPSACTLLEDPLQSPSKRAQHMGLGRTRDQHAAARRSDAMVGAAHTCAFISLRPAHLQV